MIKKGITSGAKGIVEYVTSKEYSKSKYPDITNLVLGSICWNLVERAEKIRLLAENERNESLGILTRSFLELFVQYKFILKRETDKRTESCFYAYKVSSAEKIKAMLDYDQSYHKLTENELKILQNEVPGAKGYNDYLSHYKSLSNQLYDNPKQHSQKWYNLHGEKRKFKQLMKEVGFRETDYQFFYGLGSLDIHGSAAAINFKIDKGIDSAIPLFVIYEAIPRWLNTAVTELARYYGVLKKSKVEGYLLQIGTSHKGDYLQNT